MPGPAAPARGGRASRSGRPGIRSRARLAAIDAAGRPRCPRCGALVLVTPAGLLLEPEPHELAVMLPDGGKVTARQAAEVLTGRLAPLGHHPHSQTPGYGCRPEAAQLALFAA